MSANEKVAHLTTPTGDVVTTDRTLHSTLVESMNLRGWPVGATWGEFKAAGDRLFSDGDAFDFCDYGTAINGTGRIVRDSDESSSGIREVR